MPIIQILGLIFKIYGSLWFGHYLENSPEDYAGEEFKNYAGIETGIQLENFKIKPFVEFGVESEIGRINNLDANYPFRTEYYNKSGIRIKDNLEFSIIQSCRHGHYDFFYDDEWIWVDNNYKRYTSIEGKLKF